jgi:cephalosporin hydroxylase
MQKQTELKGLLDLLSNQHPKNLLEIGTARGGMFFALAHIATSTATLISVDLPGGAFGGGYGKRGGQRLHSYTLPTQRLHLFRANSHDLDTQVQVAESLDGQLLDFLMIDGDHTREGARQDWQTYAPLVRAGGMVVFHDITPNATDPRCQVPELWQELSQSYTSLEIIEPPRQNGAGRWGGIGVLTI